MQLSMYFGDLWVECDTDVFGLSLDVFILPQLHLLHRLLNQSHLSVLLHRYLPLGLPTRLLCQYCNSQLRGLLVQVPHLQCFQWKLPLLLKRILPCSTVS